ncbi:MAG TPA: YccF domain-containing protein [Prolixibacteraceae bacterium]|nr:YccF domain-containing protein [Prolixibacteraceae bacterium]
MSFLGNLIWMVCGGLIAFLGYIIGGIALCITIVGIPFGIQVFKLAEVALWPFNKSYELKDWAPGCLSTIMNLIWLIVAGWWIVLTHLVFGLLLAITILGIPWAKQHFKMMSLAITPFGRRVVNK